MQTRHDKNQKISKYKKKTREQNDIMEDEMKNKRTRRK